MSILLISSSFKGHLNAIITLKEIIESEISNNVKTILEITDSSKNTSVDPKEFIFENCIKNIEEIESHVTNENIILIIYDFFSIEGAILSRKMKIPAVCSIPAIISDKINEKFTDELVLGHLDMLETMYDIRLPTPRYLSDGFLLEADDNIVWGFKDIYNNLPDIVYNPTYHFVGSRAIIGNVKKISQRNNVVYCSFGTVTIGSMLNIYSNQLIQMYENIINTCHYLELSLVLVCPNEIFKNLTNKHLVYKQYEYSDQIHYLKRAKLFITHGGGNSFNESIVCGCPMIVIPFFGDQFATSKYVNIHNFGFGYGNIEDFLIDCLADSTANDDMKHLSYGFYDKVKNIVGEITINTETFPKFSNELNIQEIHRAIFKNINPLSLFDKGDLLYGTTKDRKHFEKTYELDFEVGKKSNGKYTTFENLDVNYPVLIDQWNDLLREYTTEELRTSTNEKILNIIDELLEYKTHLVKTLQYDTNEKISAEDENLLKICCEGMTYFTNNNNKIHFVFKDFDKDQNIGTTLELNYMMDLITNGKDLSHFVIWIYDELSGNYLISSIKYLFEGAKLDLLKLFGLLSIDRHLIINNTFQTLLKNLKDKYVLWTDIKLMSQSDLDKKIKNKIISSVYDMVNLQIIYPWVNGLNDISNTIQIQNVFNVIKEVRNENNKIIYLYCLTHDNFPFTIQLLPTIIYTCIEQEKNSKIHQTYRTDLQNIIDAFDITKI